MKISMLILKDWLEKYSPSSEITNGEMSIAKMRLSTFGNDHEPDCLYLSYASDFVKDASGDRRIICFNNSDRLELECDNLELIINEVLEAFAFYSRWENDLRDAVYQKATFQKLIDLCFPAFECPIEFYNWKGEILGITDKYREVTDYWDESIISHKIPLKAYNRVSISDSVNVVKGITNFKFFYHPDNRYRGLFCSVPFENSIPCSLAFWGYKKPLSEGHRQLAEVFVNILLKIDYKHINYNAIQPVSTVFENILKTQTVNEEDLQKTLSWLNWQDSSCWHLLAFISSVSDKLSVSVLARVLNQEIEDGLAFSHDNKAILLLADTDFNNSLTKANNIICGLIYKCGVSLPFTNWNDLPIALTQAEVAIKYSKDSGKGINFCVDYSWRYLLDLMYANFNNNRLCHPVVLQLAEYDKNNNTDFLKTLYVYLQNESKVSHTAGALYIHLSTLKYRLRKINELANVDFDNYEVRSYILLSCELLLHEKGLIHK